MPDVQFLWDRLRPHLFGPILAAVGLTGLYQGTQASLYVFVENMHAFNHVAHQRSLMGQVMSDYSPVPEKVAFSLCVTAGLLLLSERLASGRRAEAALRLVLPVCAAAYLAIHLTLGAWLRVTDIQFLPPMDSSDVPTREYLLWVNSVGIVVAGTGIVLALVYLWRPREIWLVAQIAAAFLGAVGIGVVFPLEPLYSRGELGYYHPSVLQAAVLFTTPVALGGLLRQRGLPFIAKPQHPHTAMLLTTTWSWVAFFMCSYFAAVSYHCMCLVGYHELQEAAGRIITVAAMHVWALVVLAQAWRFWRRRLSWAAALSAAADKDDPA